MFQKGQVFRLAERPQIARICLLQGGIVIGDGLAQPSEQIHVDGAGFGQRLRVKADRFQPRCDRIVVEAQIVPDQGVLRAPDVAQRHELGERLDVEDL